MLSTKKLLGFGSAAQGKRKGLKRKQTQQPKKQSKKKLPRVRVHLGNLAENTQTSDVWAFSPMATLVDLKFEEGSNICKGFGFLEFKTKKAAEKALKKNGQILNGNVVALKLVGEENVELPFQQGHVIGVLDFEVNDTLPQIRQRLEAHFEKCGPIKQLFLPPNLNLQNHEGIAYIEFKDYEGFKKAFHQKYARPLPGDSVFLKIIRPKFEEMPFLHGMGGGRGGKWGYKDANGFIEDDLPQDPTRHMGTGEKIIFID